VDRRSTFDDGRGMGEGVLDNKRTVHKYWLALEGKGKERKGAVPAPSATMQVYYVI